MKKGLFLGAALMIGTLAMTIPTFAANGSWKEDNKGYRYQFSDGTFAYSSWLSLDDKWYHIDSSGYMQKGWLKDGDDWYYLDTDNGQMQEGWSKINNKWYYFDPMLGGRMAVNRYVDVMNNENKDYYVDSSGVYNSEGNSGAKVDAKKISTEAFEKKAVELINNERAKYGIQSLSDDSMFADSVHVRAKELAQKYSHTRPDGDSYLYALPPGLAYYGEVIAVGQTTPEEVVKYWMDAEVNRAQILGKDYSSFGVGCYIKDGIIYWVADFGIRM